MAKTTVRTTATNFNDAEFRVWGKSICDELIACGIGVASDTGQINWATVPKPASGFVGGYAIFYLNDSLHATKPCYFKLEFATGSSSQYPAMFITASSSTNGAGTMSGTIYMSRKTIIIGSDVSRGHWPSYFCVLSGYAFYATCRGATETNAGKMFFFAVQRICDAAGEPTADGFHFYTQGLSGIGSGVARRQTHILLERTDTNCSSLIPGGIINTANGQTMQVFRHFGTSAANEIRVVPNMLTFLENEIGDQCVITVTPVGTQPRQYITLGSIHGPSTEVAAGGTAINGRMAMRWE